MNKNNGGNGKKNRLGTYSLIGAGAGFAAFETSIKFFGLGNPVWRILATGFEAGTVGGLADWFAVSALFHNIPIPFLRRHTNIIVKNRDRLTKAASEWVQNELVTPESIGSIIKDFRICFEVVRHLESPKHFESFMKVVRDALRRMAELLDSKDTARFFEKVIKDQISEADIGGLLGRFIVKAVTDGDLDHFIDSFMATIRNTLADKEIDLQIRGMLRNAINEYKSRGWLKNAGVSIAEHFQIIDVAVFAEAAHNALLAEIDGMQEDQDNPIRSKLTMAIETFGKKLAAGDTKIHNTLNILREKILQNSELTDSIQSMLSHFKGTVIDELSHSGSAFDRVIRKYIRDIFKNLKADPKMQERIDVWLKREAVDLLRTNKTFVGSIVEESMSKLNNADLAKQIEEKVGNDLQYIRVNGAIVGCVAGLILATLQFFLSFISG